MMLLWSVYASGLCIDVLCVSASVYVCALNVCLPGGGAVVIVGPAALGLVVLTRTTDLTRQKTSKSAP